MTLVARKKLDEDKVCVQYDLHHQGHEANSIEEWHSLRLSSGLRKWLSKVVALEINYEVFRDLTRPDELSLTVLESEDMVNPNDL